MKYCTVCKTKYDDSVSFCAVDGEVLEGDPSSIVGTVLDGQYQIESLLGKGGMGAVFRARHILLGDRVAIKVLPPEMRNNAEWLRRFRREGQAARRFRHPNAVTVYDLRTTNDGIIYMVMEYVEGHTLDAEIKARGQFTPADAVTVLNPIMSVLNAAHEMGVVHRDLKPENIMIGKATGTEPNVKLLDLGIAKLREVAGVEAAKSTALTVAGQMLGTPYYMSPEQWGELQRDGNEEIDGRADIYSLALVFYEMIAGRRPYAALTLLELRKEHVTITPPPLFEVVSGVPKAFSDVIARAMAKDRDDRPATMGELAAELKGSVDRTGNGSGQFVSVIRESTGGSDTAAVVDRRDTNTDVNAPTIITMDAMPAPVPAAAGQETIAEPRPAAEAGAGASAAQTIADTRAQTKAESNKFTNPGAVIPAPAASSVPAPAPVPVHAPAPTRSSVPLIIGVVLLLVLVGGVGGYLAWKWMRTPAANAPASGANNNPVSPATRELARYWLEVSPPTGKPTSSQVVPKIPIASGQYLKFHFTPAESGFLYIVGPGDNNQLTAFLTAKPAPEATGWSTNEIKPGTDVSFPTGLKSDGDERWLALDKRPGTETYIIIFSPTPLQALPFLRAAKPGDVLSPAEQQEFNSFVDKHKKDTATEYPSSDPAAPYVSLKSAVPSSAENPLVVEIRIEHK